MKSDSNGSAARLAWDKPRLVELKLGMGNVENSYLPASDGSDPGPPDVSES